MAVAILEKTYFVEALLLVRSRVTTDGRSNTG